MVKRQQSLTALNLAAGNSRRVFLGNLGGAAALGMTTNAVGLSPLVEAASGHEGLRDGRERVRESFEIRKRAAEREREIAIPAQLANGDEQRYGTFIGNYSKGLPHNVIGEVDKAAYQRLVDAAEDGRVGAFENVPLGGNMKLVNPMAGIAFDLEGTDSHQLAIGPPPALASQVRADDMVELYWMALCRDVNFTQYGSDPLAQAAAAELSSLAGFAGPMSGREVTAQSLFRGFTAGDVVGPYVSQLLLRPFNYGQYAMSGRITTYVSGVDYLADQNTWLAARNGQGPFAKNQSDPQTRFVRNGRDLSAFTPTKLSRPFTTRGFGWARMVLQRIRGTPTWR